MFIEIYNSVTGNYLSMDMFTNPQLRIVITFSVPVILTTIVLSKQQRHVFFNDDSSGGSYYYSGDYQGVQSRIYDTLDIENTNNSSIQTIKINKQQGRRW